MLRKDDGKLEKDEGFFCACSEEGKCVFQDLSD